MSHAGAPTYLHCDCSQRRRVLRLKNLGSDEGGGGGCAPLVSVGNPASYTRAFLGLYDSQEDQSCDHIGIGNCTGSNSHIQKDWFEHFI